MIWSLIKLCVFCALAIGSGILCATVPIGGKTIATRAQTLWAQPEVKRGVDVIETRVKRGVAAATADDPPAAGRAPQPAEPPVPRGTQVDPHAVAKVVSDAPAGDAFRDSERQAVQRIIHARTEKAAQHSKR